MTTPLTKPLKRELQINGRAFVVTLSAEGIKLTLKGKRKGQELLWNDLVSGEAALAAALNASLKEIPEPPQEAPPTRKKAPGYLRAAAKRGRALSEAQQKSPTRRKEALAGAGARRRSARNAAPGNREPSRSSGRTPK
jgi:hypothetical protein